MGMATYTIIPHAGFTSFDVAVIGANGAKQTMLGFQTEEDAEAWIVIDQALTNHQSGDC